MHHHLRRWSSAAVIAAVLFFTGLLVPVSAHAQSRALPFPLKVPVGFDIELVSNTLKGARFLAVAPNGDVIVSQISQGRVVAVRPGSSPDSPPILVADGLERPNGLAFRGNDLYSPPGRVSWSCRTIRRASARRGRSFRTCRATRTTTTAPSRWLPTAASSFPRGRIAISQGRRPRLATILHYDAEGRHGSIYARGLRNAERARLRSGRPALGRCEPEG